MDLQHPLVLARQDAWEPQELQPEWTLPHVFPRPERWEEQELLLRESALQPH